jgi:hypothetical protein
MTCSCHAAHCGFLRLLEALPATNSSTVTSPRRASAAYIIAMSSRLERLDPRSSFTVDFIARQQKKCASRGSEMFLRCPSRSATTIRPPQKPGQTTGSPCRTVKRGAILHLDGVLANHSISECVVLVFSSSGGLVIVYLT